MRTLSRHEPLSKGRRRGTGISAGMTQESRRQAERPDGGVPGKGESRRSADHVIVGRPAPGGTRRPGTNTAHDKRRIGCYGGEARKAAGHSDGCGRRQRHKPPNRWSAGSNSVAERPDGSHRFGRGGSRRSAGQRILGRPRKDFTRRPPPDLGDRYTTRHGGGWSTRFVPDSVVGALPADPPRRPFPRVSMRRTVSSHAALGRFNDGTIRMVACGLVNAVRASATDNGGLHLLQPTQSKRRRNSVAAFVTYMLGRLRLRHTS